MKSFVKHKIWFFVSKSVLSVQIERRIKIYLKIVSIQYEVQFWSWNTKMYLKDISLKLSPIFHLPYYVSGIFNIKMVFFDPVWPGLFQSKMINSSKNRNRWNLKWSKFPWIHENISLELSCLLAQTVISWKFFYEKNSWEKRRWK